MEPECDEVLSIFAFRFNLRRYIQVLNINLYELLRQNNFRGLSMVGRCRLTLSKPRLNRLELSA